MKQTTIESSFGNARPVPESTRTKLLEGLQDLVSTLTPAGKSTDAPDAGEIEDLIRARSRRLKHFSARLFADPAWDMLLELYAAELGQRRVSVTSLGIASGSPATTALRWMTTLQQEGLVDREDDPLDGRRSYVKLSQAGSKAMADYFTNVPPGLSTL